MNRLTAPASARELLFLALLAGAWWWWHRDPNNPAAGISDALLAGTGAAVAARLVLR